MTVARTVTIAVAGVALGVAIGWLASDRNARGGTDPRVRERVVAACNATRETIEGLARDAAGGARGIGEPDRVYAKLTALIGPASICATDPDGVLAVIDRGLAPAQDAELKPRLQAMIADMLALLPKRSAQDEDLGRWKP